MRRDDNHESWGRQFRFRHEVYSLSSTAENPFSSISLTAKSVLPYGLGRSYGDSCLNADGELLLTRGLNRFISFDRDTGVLRAEAGVSLAEIIGLVLPQGWFLPVTPGTKYVTLGGALANDVHGKNHHAAGTFGRSVLQFLLRRSDGQTYLCSPTQNAELFRASIGGLGLTGLILWAEIQLKSVKGGDLYEESLRLENLDDYFLHSAESDQNFEYTVAWIDTLQRGRHLGRGILMRANHLSDSRGSSNTMLRKPLFSIPCEAPSWLLSKTSMKIFNELYYGKQFSQMSRRQVNYDSFFYPLDAVSRWNLLYGRRGFCQYQFVLPFEKRDTLKEILDRVAYSGLGSFLSVLKNFGSLPSPGLLSFARPGFTLAMDFADRGERTRQLFGELDVLVQGAGGRLYPAKDSSMTDSFFREAYPEVREFLKWKDPHFSSSFWRRVMPQ